MFNCRICTENPFGGGGGGEKKKAPKKADKKQRGGGFHPRTKEQARDLVQQYMGCVTDRAKHEFGGDAAIAKALEAVLPYIDENVDPIFLPETCAAWHGSLDAQGAPSVMMVKPGKTEQEETNVLRLLAFIFADEASFEILARMERTVPYTMECGDPTCINLTHIHLPE
mmetsp:Transcript_74619/g.155597  ORF Transcript_74619/g.155597 Transcript_74619/m.155597 type:complete len:169 (+) Transcript_74619:216-722(+)